MGCISSKPSIHHQVIIPSHHLLSVDPPSNTKHTNHEFTPKHDDDDTLTIHTNTNTNANTKHTNHEFTPPKHDDDDTLTIHTNTNTNTNINLKVTDAVERCSSFHTVEEYDELLQRITNHKDAAELAGVPVPDTTELACDDDSNIETRDNERQDIMFQTVASLRQWLQAPGGGGGAHLDADAAIAGFSFYANNSNSTPGPEDNSVLVKTGTQQEEESIVELVAAFDKYMQQLQIDEENILKQIQNMIN